MTPRVHAEFVTAIYLESGRPPLSTEQRDGLCDVIADRIAIAIREARKSERERAAKMADSYTAHSHVAKRIAVAIRSLPEDQT